MSAPPFLARPCQSRAIAFERSSILFDRHGRAKTRPSTRFPAKKENLDTGFSPERFASVVRDVDGRNKSMAVRFEPWALVLSTVMVALGATIHEFASCRRDDSRGFTADVRVLTLEVVDGTAKPCHDAVWWRASEFPCLGSARDIRSFDRRTISIDGWHCSTGQP